MIRTKCNQEAVFGFMEFECGCIGVCLDEGDPVVVCQCDLEGEASWESYSFRRRPDLKEKTATPVNADRLIEDIGALIADGYRFRKIKGLLNT
jgi:hypothetical protein